MFRSWVGRRALIAMLGASCLLVSSCGGVGSEEPSGDQVRITTMGFGLPDEHATARVDAFRSANPDIEVRVNEGGFDEQQFLSAIAADDAPDMVYVDRNRIGSLAARGAIVPIDDCIEREKVDLDQYREQAVEQVRLDDKVYGLPEFHMVRVLILNNTVLREAGLQPQDLSTTDWGRLPALTSQLAKVDGGKLARIGFDPKVPDFLPMWVEANGGELVSDDGRTAKLDSPEVLEAARVTIELVQQQGGWAEFKAFKDSFDFFGAKNQYVTGQLAAMPMEAWYLNTLAANSPEVDITVSPFTDRQGKPISYATGQAWAIPKGSPNPEQACKFIASMTNADTWVLAAKARRDALAKDGKKYSGTYTANKTADERIFDEVYTAKDDKIVDAGVQTALSVQDTASSLPGGPASYEVVTAYTSAVNRVLNGQQPLEEAMAQAQQEASDAIAKAGK
jgi:multiple sugar transport system substrate-binding protein